MISPRLSRPAGSACPRCSGTGRVARTASFAGFPCDCTKGQYVTRAPRSPIDGITARNLAEMQRLNAAFDLRIVGSLLSWRPTRQNRGSIPGVADGLTILCTDGVVGFFLKPDGSILYGHIGHFDGGVESLWSEDRSGARAKRPRPESAAARRKRLLDDL